MKTSIQTSLILMSFIGLGGCATTRYVPVTIPSSSLSPKEKIIGVGSGIGATLDDAEKNAVGSNGADGLRDVYAEEELNCTGTQCTPTGRIRVVGALIQNVGTSSTSAPDIPEKSQETSPVPTDVISGTITQATFTKIAVDSKIEVTLKNNRVLKGVFRGTGAAGQDWFWIKQPDEFTQTQINYKDVQSIEPK